MKNQVVIIGGGFAGRQASRALRNSPADVVLLDPSPFTTMLPALPDLAGNWISEHWVKHPLADLLPPNVRHFQQAVSSIHLDTSTVMAGNTPIAYDHLLIAAGSAPNFYNVSFPRDLMHPLATVEDALRIQKDFGTYLQNELHPHVLVAGSGYTGLELAMSLFFRAKANGKTCAVTIVDPTPVLLPSLPDQHRQYVLNFLTAQGAHVRLGVAIESFNGQDAVAGGITYKNVFFCWAAGSTLAVPDIQGQVERLRDGRLKVLPDLSLPNYPNVFAAGDSAAILQNGQPLRKAVNFAYYGGRHMGNNVARRLHGKPTRPFHPIDLGWVVPFHETSIGRLPFGLWVKGRLGVRLHHLMCGLRNYSFKNFAGCVQLAMKGNTP